MCRRSPTSPVRSGTASRPAIPRVSIIVPACNEAADIEATLTRLLALEYDNYEVIAVDDRSTDRTGEIMERIAAARAARPAQGYSHRRTARRLDGQAARHVERQQLATGDWLLFTDADVLFKPDALRRALAYAESERADHLVLFPRMIMKHPGEKMMIAFFQTLFVFGHRPWKVADPKTKDHMGVGAFNMIRRQVYDALGTYQALRFEVLDDMKLGKVVKNAGYAQRNVFGDDLISIRWAKGAWVWWTISPRISSPSCHSSGRGRWPPASRLLSEPDAIRRNSAGAWLGAAGHTQCALFSMFSIYVGMSTQVGYSALLLRAASREHGVVCLHHAAFDIPDLGARGSVVARNFLSVGWS